MNEEPDLDYSQYDDMYAKALTGEITQEAWFDYCLKKLNQIMRDNKDVFICWKNR